MYLRINYQHDPDKFKKYESNYKLKIIEVTIKVIF